MRKDRASTSLDEQAPVMLVDDMGVVRATVATFLQAEGHLVVTAANGEEALELLRNGLTPFAIILDLVMPRKTASSSAWRK